MNVPVPAFELKWNLNTVTILIGFASGFVAWGYTLSAMQGGLAGSAADVARLNERVVAVERTIRQIDNHELRIGNVEKQAADAAAAMRDVNTTLNGLAADMRVTKEILQRLEFSQRRSRFPQQ